MNVGSEKVVLVNCLLLVSRVPRTSYAIDRERAFLPRQCVFLFKQKRVADVLFARDSNENCIFIFPAIWEKHPQM